MAMNARCKSLIIIIAIVLITVAIGAYIVFAGNGRSDHQQTGGTDNTVTSEVALTEVQINEGQITEAGIVVRSANPGTVRNILILPGEIRFNEDRTAHVVPRLAGVVQTVSAQLGQRVKKGEALAIIASTSLAQQRSDLFIARQRLAMAQVTFAREKKLWQEKISAEQDYLQALQALREAEISVQAATQQLAALGADTPSSTSSRAQLSHFVLRAPFAGTIVEKHITLGEVVKEDASVLTIVDLSSVWAEIAIPAKDIGAVRLGEKVAVNMVTATTATTTPPGLNASTLRANGKITYIGAQFGAQTRTGMARIELANLEGFWRAGLSVNVEIIADTVNVPVAVEVNALQDVEGESVVFKKTDAGFVAQKVKTGRSDGRLIEIVQGLDAGSRYASEGSFLIKSELGKSSAEHSH